MKQDEAAFVARGRALAAKYHAYLGMGLGVLNSSRNPGPPENSPVIILRFGSSREEFLCTSHC